VIVSHEHKFVFIKTHKTASTSIEVLLSPIAGDDAVVTPVIPPEPGHMDRNWRGLFNPVPELLSLPGADTISGRRTEARSTWRNLVERRRYVNHMSARTVRARLGRRRWDGYFTFCFERNPWEKVASRYRWAQNEESDADGGGSGFETWVKRGGAISDWPLYTINGGVAVDFVGRYERLAEDLAMVLVHLGLEVPFALPSAKRTERQPVATPLTDALIAERFRNEIEAFGYMCPTRASS
jgi:hypothetical protein